MTSWITEITEVKRTWRSSEAWIRADKVSDNNKTNDSRLPRMKATNQPKFVILRGCPKKRIARDDGFVILSIAKNQPDFLSIQVYILTSCYRKVWRLILIGCPKKEVNRGEPPIECHSERSEESSSVPFCSKYTKMCP